MFNQLPDTPSAKSLVLILNYIVTEVGQIFLRV